MKKFIILILLLGSTYNAISEINEKNEIESFSSIDAKFGLASIVNESQNFLNRGFSVTASYSYINEYFMISGQIGLMYFSGRDNSGFRDGLEYNTMAYNTNLGIYYKFIDNYNFDLITPYAGIELGYIVANFEKPGNDVTFLLPTIDENFFTISPIIGVSFPMNYSLASYFELRYMYVPKDFGEIRDVNANFPRHFNIVNITAGLRFAI